jgi:4,5-epoxidase
LSGADLQGGWGLFSEDASLRKVATARLGEHVAVLAHGSGSDAMLVRPDGHLAWRGDEPARLDRWLHQALNAGTVR